MDFVANAPPVIGEGPFGKKKVRRECESERNRETHEECRREPFSNLLCWVYLRCDISHGGEDGHPIGMLTRRVENDDVENLEEKDFCPRVSSHGRRAGWIRLDEGGEVAIASWK